jgi:hypothetical protein
MNSYFDYCMLRGCQWSMWFRDLSGSYKPVDCREMTVCAEQVIVVGKEKCLLLIASVDFY